MGKERDGETSRGSGGCEGVPNSCEEICDGESRRRERTWYMFDKTCGCGCVRLSDLPLSCEWVPLGDDKLSLHVPESMKEILRRATKESARSSFEGTVEIKPFPCVCDAFLPKLKAIEMANDLSSTLLRIAFSISEK